MDTGTVVNVRNRIRLASILCVFGTMVYLTLSKEFVQRHTSHLHLFHILLQPIVLFGTINENSHFSHGIFIVSLMPLVLDGFVAFISFLSVRRCIDQSSASCFDRLYEQGTWFLLGCWFLVFDIMISSQIYLLTQQLRKKDNIENKTKQILKLQRQTPSFHDVKVAARKSKVISTYLILFDIIYFINLALLSEEGAFFMIGIVHGGLDIYNLLNNTQQTTKFFYNILRIGHLFSLIIYIIIMITVVQMDTSINKNLIFLITFTYIVADAVQLFFLHSAISCLTAYDTLKSVL